MLDNVFFELMIFAKNGGDHPALRLRLKGDGEMLWIILIGDETLNIDAIKNIEHYGANRMTELEKDRIVVSYGEDHIFYQYNENIIDDYEDEDVKRMPFKNPNLIIMTYISEKRMKEVLRQDNFIKGIYIDNDYGDIIPIEEFNLREGL